VAVRITILSSAMWCRVVWYTFTNVCGELVAFNRQDKGEPKNWGSRFLRNVGNMYRNYTASVPRRPYSERSCTVLFIQALSTSLTFLCFFSCLSVCLSIYLSIYGSTVLCWALADFSVYWSFTQSVGFLGWEISPPQGRYLYTGQHKQNKRT
jgi:hypothetical protein